MSYNTKVLNNMVFGGRAKILRILIEIVKYKKPCVGPFITGCGDF